MTEQNYTLTRAELAHYLDRAIETFLYLKDNPHCLTSVARVNAVYDTLDLIDARDQEKERTR
jgi:hypothetical protein